MKKLLSVLLLITMMVGCIPALAEDAPASLHFVIWFVIVLFHARIVEGKTRKYLFCDTLCDKSAQKTPQGHQNDARGTQSCNFAALQSKNPVISDWQAAIPKDLPFFHEMKKCWNQT